MNSRVKIISAYILPRTQDILFLVIFTAALLFGPLMLNMDGDLPRHLLTGKYILETRTIPANEPFVFPYQDKPFISHSNNWLIDCIFYLIYQVAGLTGLSFFSAAVLATTFYILYSYTIKQSGTRLSTLFLIIWGMGVTSLNWVTRPHIVSMLFFVICLVWLDKLSKNENVKLWGFPLLILLWSNIHIEFVVGFLVIIAYAAGWVWDYLFNKPLAKIGFIKNLLIIATFSFIASLFNPAGISPWKTLFRFVNNDYLMSRMYEARQPDFSQSSFLALLGLLVFSIILLAIKKQKLSTAHALILAGFSGMSLIAGRNVHLYGIAAPFVLVEAIRKDDFHKIFQKIENNLYLIEGSLKGAFWPAITLIIFSITFFSSPLKRLYMFNDQLFPIQATKWLDENPQSGNLFNDLNWGGYLAFYLWPNQKVFVDSMADITGELTYEYESVLTLTPQKDKILTKYNIEWALIKTGSPLAKALEQEGWFTLYTDQTATILRK